MRISIYALLSGWSMLFARSRCQHHQKLNKACTSLELEASMSSSLSVTRCTCGEDGLGRISTLALWPPTWRYSILPVVLGAVSRQEELHLEDWSTQPTLVSVDASSMCLEGMTVWRPSGAPMTFMNWTWTHLNGRRWYPLTISTSLAIPGRCMEREWLLGIMVCLWCTVGWYPQTRPLVTSSYTTFKMVKLKFTLLAKCLCIWRSMQSLLYL